MRIPGVVSLFALGLATASAQPQFKFTSIEFPGAVRTSVFGINNNGDIVGRYKLGVGGAFPEHGFVRRRGAFTTIDFPAPPSQFNRPLSINVAGDIVGGYL